MLVPIIVVSFAAVMFMYELAQPGSSLSPRRWLVVARSASERSAGRAWSSSQAPLWDPWAARAAAISWCQSEHDNWCCGGLPRDHVRLLLVASMAPRGALLVALAAPGPSQPAAPSRSSRASTNTRSRSRSTASCRVAILYVGVGLDARAATSAVLLTGLAELFYHWNVSTPRWIGFFLQRPESHCVHHQTDLHHYNYSGPPALGTCCSARSRTQRPSTGPAVLETLSTTSARCCAVSM